MNTVCSTERKSFPERINQTSEVPQTETMIPISQLLDDKGQEIPEWMSTHPSSAKRIVSLTNWIPEIIIKYPPMKKIS